MASNGDMQEFTHKYDRENAHNAALKRGFYTTISRSDDEDKLEERVQIKLKKLVSQIGQHFLQKIIYNR